MLYYTHTYAPDALLLHLCLTRLRELDPEAMVIIANDPGNPVPDALLPWGCPWVEIIPTPYPLGGNLNGAPMIAGMLATLIWAMQRHSTCHIVKIDCDTWLNYISWLRPGRLAPEGQPEPDYIGLEGHNPLTATGDIYRLSRYAAREALGMLQTREIDPRDHLPEDRTILELVLRARAHVLTVPYTQGRHIGMHDKPPGDAERAAWVVHCGEPCRDGARCPRDMALLRMRLLAAACCPPDSPCRAGLSPQ